ncbi:MAG: OmpA family protein [Actinomycetota bacterium]
MARSRSPYRRGAGVRRPSVRRATSPRRSRARSGRSGSWKPRRSPAWTVVPAVLVFLGALVVVVITQWERLPFDSLSQNRTPSDLGRFDGLGDMVVETADTSMYWWKKTTIGETVVPGELPPEFSAGTTERPIQRTVLPSGITFRADSAELSPEALENIRIAAQSIPEAFIKITVLCHSSADGTTESRLPLSQERADVLARELETMLGLSPGTIERLGLGDQYPVAGIDPESPTGRLVNRRCEILVES